MWTVIYYDGNNYAAVIYRAASAKAAAAHLLSTSPDISVIAVIRGTETLFMYEEDILVEMSV